MKNRRGFSLVEILIVIGLMGTLAVVVLLPYSAKKNAVTEATETTEVSGLVIQQQAEFGQFVVSDVPQMFIPETNLKVVSVTRRSDSARFAALADINRVFMPGDPVVLTSVSYADQWGGFANRVMIVKD